MKYWKYTYFCQIYEEVLLNTHRFIKYADVLKMKEYLVNKVFRLTVNTIHLKKIYSEVSTRARELNFAYVNVDSIKTYTAEFFFEHTVK